MAIKLEKITFKLIRDWKEAIRGLGETIGTEKDREILHDQFKKGVCLVYKMSNGTYFLTRGEGTELVICCIKGRNLKMFANIIYQVAKEQGFKTVRFHASRPTNKILHNFQPQFIGKDANNIAMYRVNLK